MRYCVPFPRHVWVLDGSRPIKVKVRSTFVVLGQLRKVEVIYGDGSVKQWKGGDVYKTRADATAGLGVIDDG